MIGMSNVRHAFWKASLLVGRTARISYTFRSAWSLKVGADGSDMGIVARWRTCGILVDGVAGFGVGGNGDFSFACAGPASV